MKLNADDSRRLLCDLNNMCSPEEVKRRTNLARQRLAEMTRPKFRKSKFKEIIKRFIEFALRRNRSKATKVK